MQTLETGEDFIDSFIAWIGGKKLLRNTILNNFPQDKKIERYIEVFGGAGWVLFSKDKHAELEVFNDVNSNLINLYRCIKYHYEELQRELDWLLVSREMFMDYKSQMVSQGLTDIQRAARYFLIVKISFGADRKSFGTNKKNLNSSIEYLAEIKERLKNVVIENKDFENLIKVYDREGALFYLDPPYLGTEKYYDDCFTLNDHERLRNILGSIKGKFILSYNNDERIRAMYKDFKVEEVSRHSSLTAKGKSGEEARYGEVLVRNY